MGYIFSVPHPQDVVLLQYLYFHKQTSQTPITAVKARKAVSAAKNNFVAVDLSRGKTQLHNSIMGKKRKVGGRPAAKGEAPARTKFDIEERFDDSEDEFQTGRDQILLDEGPETKRRRRVAEEGMCDFQSLVIRCGKYLTLEYRGDAPAFRRRDSGL